MKKPNRPKQSQKRRKDAYKQYAYLAHRSVTPGSLQYLQLYGSPAEKTHAKRSGRA